MSDPEEREKPEPSKPDAGEKGGRETMWAAVGALAAVVAALIALLTYVIPQPSSAPAPQTTSPAPASAAASIQAGRPVGCDEARAAINTYNQTAGTTTNSQANAASQAYGTLLPLSTEATGAVSSDITDVAEDFYVMNQIQTGAMLQSYPAAVQQTNSDIHTLSTACGFS